MYGAYRGPGITLGPSLTFGYFAARHVVGNGVAAGAAGDDLRDSGARAGRRGDEHV
jgi:hypothetical protein